MASALLPIAASILAPLITKALFGKGLIGGEDMEDVSDAVEMTMHQPQARATLGHLIEVGGGVVGGKKKKKRKPSAYNKFVSEEMKDGATMEEAIRAWGRSGKRKSTKKRKGRGLIGGLYLDEVGGYGGALIGGARRRRKSTKRAPARRRRGGAAITAQDAYYMDQLGIDRKDPTDPTKREKVGKLLYEKLVNTPKEQIKRQKMLDDAEFNNNMEAYEEAKHYRDKYENAKIKELKEARKRGNVRAYDGISKMYKAQYGKSFDSAELKANPRLAFTDFPLLT